MTPPHATADAKEKNNNQPLWMHLGHPMPPPPPIFTTLALALAILVSWQHLLVLLVLQHAARQNSQLCRENKMKKSKNQPVRHPHPVCSSLNKNKKQSTCETKTKTKTNNQQTGKKRKQTKSSCAVQGASYATTPWVHSMCMQPTVCESLQCSMW